MKKLLVSLSLVFLFSCSKDENLESKVVIVEPYGHKDTIIVHYYGRLGISESNLSDQNDVVKAKDVTSFSVIETKGIDGTKVINIKK